jgi:hypothetical protein
LATSQVDAHTAERIDALQRLVSKKDCIIVGRGPSLHEVKDLLRTTDPATTSLIGINEVEVLRREIFEPAGRDMDVLVLTHSDVLRGQIDLVADWLRADPSKILCLASWFRSAAMTNPDLAAIWPYLDRVLWFDCSQEFCLPWANRPLNFPGINTLICAIGCVYLAGPSRIFLLGFDGKADVDLDSDDGIYFHQGAKIAAAATGDVPGWPSFKRKHDFWLRWDSLRVSEIAPVFLRHLSLLYGAPVTPVYNVCPDSAIDCFPRISAREFEELTAIPRAD